MKSKICFFFAKMTYFVVPSQDVSPLPNTSGQYYASGELRSDFLIKKFPFK